MPTAFVEDETSDSLAELVQRLGDIPLQRIRRIPPPGTATEADVLAAEARPRKRICELIDGVLVEKAIAFRESLLAIFLGGLLEQFVSERNLGIVTGEQGMMRFWLGRVRVPDVAYISWARLPGGQIPTAPIPDVSPDLAIEILSPTNTEEEMKLKRKDYFKAGTKIVWVIDLETRTAAIYKSVRSCRRLTATDTLDGNNVLPGFQLPLATLFGKLDRRAGSKS